MDSLAVTLKSSEHWLTVMTCTICERTPDVSPMYKCNLGHMVCLSCFEKLSQWGTPRCKICHSTIFMPRQVSKDFLQKLKVKPGIGRPRRYELNSLKSENSESGDSDGDYIRDYGITLEKLFQLSTNQVKQLFDVTAKKKVVENHRLKGKPSWSNSKWSSDIFCTAKYEPSEKNQYLADTESGILGPRMNTPSAISLNSKKPITCPHGDCKKVVTISSFFQHYKHDHGDIPIYSTERSTELHLIHDIRVVNFDTTYCLAVIKLFELHKANLSCTKTKTIADRFNQQVPVGTFWLMVSGSKEERKSRSYVLFWLMTNSDDHFTCTLELSSAKENFSNSTFCSVNSLFDSHTISDIVSGLNCLYLCYPSVCNLLEDGVKLHLRITIH